MSEIQALATMCVGSILGATVITLVARAVLAALLRALEEEVDDL